MSIFEVDHHFIEQKIALFTPEQTTSMRSFISNLSHDVLEQHELLAFGRMVVHDHPFFNEWQSEICARVSNIVGEEVESNYNFLSLYNNLGHCELHRDAPAAKWTVDHCIEQSAPWDIFISDPLPWKDEEHQAGDQWADNLKSNTTFRTHALTAGETLVFGGSSQWHYRNRIPKTKNQNFCHLIFFHFIPAGSKELTLPENWAAYFGIAAIDEVIIRTADAVTASYKPQS